jgi:succinate dehydrogenase / fumarate reductase, cytochrome b subunit
MGKNSYLFRKIHSLLGIVPVGFFLINHLLTNYEATSGHQEFIDAGNWIQGLPLLLFLEIFMIYLPLTYHAIYGLYVAYTARNNITSYSYFRNQMFFWQRVTGVITFLFVAWHIFETRIQVALGNVTHEQLGITMHEIVTNPVMMTIYIIAVVAASFHFCNGIWGFLVSWGITVGPRAQAVSTVICMALFVVMSVMFIMTLFAFSGAEFQQLPATAK